MDLFARLRHATEIAQQEAELPDFLARRIFAIADHPQSYPLEVVGELVEQVSLYDTYAQTGYMGMGVNNTILEGTIRRLEAARKG
jgi:hypothetical protein